MMIKKVKFIDTHHSLFYSTVRQRVDEYFKVNQLAIQGNALMWFKAVFFLGTFVTLYLLLMLGHFSVVVMLLLVILLGAFGAFVGFNICHDAIHKSFSRYQSVNKVFGVVFSVIGASAYVWSLIHNVVHHTYTNIAQHDEDIDVAPGLLRFSENEKVNKLQQYQHLYAFFLYSFAMLTWVFRKDYKKFFQKQIGGQAFKHPKIEYFNLFFFKFSYYFLFIILPFIVLDVTWYQFLVGFLVMQFTQGLVLGLVFQLAHVVEGTAFPVPNDEGSIEEAWANHQMMTTANFSSNSKVVSFFLGGLNRQIEHHLFPKVCHIHYQDIGHIVKKTALEFNLPYIENTTFFTALQSHYRLLKTLGKVAYRNQKND